jgi:3-hydroxybutyryl-CoA dehydratase
LRPLEEFASFSDEFEGGELMPARRDEPLYFNEVEIGDSWDSPARTVTETDVVNFAALTGDYNPLHVDHEFAKTTLFGKPIAHGLLGISFSAGLTSHCPWMHTVAFVKLREWSFLKPIFFGDTVFVRTEVIAKDVRGRGKRGLITWKRQLINQREVVVQEGNFETLVEIKNDAASR